MADLNRVDRGSVTAKTIAIVALIVALIALGWAIKADRRANEAVKKSREAYNTNVEVPLDNDDAGDDSMQSTDPSGDVEPQESDDTGAPGGSGVNSQTDATDPVNDPAQ